MGNFAYPVFWEADENLNFPSTLFLFSDSETFDLSSFCFSSASPT
ncbi:hypothetical protein B6N60_04412 [Richelia sinica FACHB-800]|uniref:Uncharacterized protein n=1 Tax=Richelia sinica FACHB-800 TaxID=1357546 RepID=A0A975Y6W5_9NOST|nr:hypothetical protein B6N60_04412 [Richelia sinica FACHB-800]